MILDVQSVKKQMLNISSLLMIALCMLPTAAAFSALPVLRPAQSSEQTIHSACRIMRRQCSPLSLRLVAKKSEDFAVGDRVEFLVKTVAFSRKILANGMSAIDLSGVVKFVTTPTDPEELAMVTVGFNQVQTRFHSISLGHVHCARTLTFSVVSHFLSLCISLSLSLSRAHTHTS